jgi:hypothetical protein
MIVTVRYVMKAKAGFTSLLLVVSTGHASKKAQELLAAG